MRDPRPKTTVRVAPATAELIERIMKLYPTLKHLTKGNVIDAAVEYYMRGITKDVRL